ncbi:holdfast anchor protein HfaD, partial [Rhizobium sp. CRIBSB]|nr:holdfast anchor protein HfaD [Rhizobium sp. CRIBSB]
MARPAPIRLAGMIAATATFAAVATEAPDARAQSQDRTIVLNNQLQLGDVVAGETLNVVDTSEQVTVSASAQGNSLAGSVQNDAIDIRSTQEMRGDAVATADMTFGGETEGVVNAVVQAGGNYLAGGAYDADLAVHATQLNTGGEVSATSTIAGGTARLLDGASVGVSAISNTIALGGEGASVSGVISQGSSATVRASNQAATQYIPAQAAFSSQAIANAVAVNSEAASNQALYVRQRSTGDVIEAATSANAGNAWDLAGRARASGNQAVFANQGGALIAETDQGNT